MHYIREYGTTVLIMLTGAAVIYLFAVGGTHPLSGKTAPDFALSDLDGKSVKLASHRGKDVVVLDFWASWCPPCREGLPVVDAVAKKFSDQPVAVYAVNIQENKEAVEEFVRKNNLTLPILLDDTGIVAEDYGVTGIPQTVIIDKTGTVHRVHVGVSLFSFEDELSRDINEALAKNIPTP